MFTLPSIWNILISTLVFFIASWRIRRYLDEMSIPKGMTRATVIIVFAYLAAWLSGSAVDYLHDKIFGVPKPVETSQEVSKLLKELGAAKH